MSTRCQVKVIQEGLDWQEERTLYHHWDGYPENMIPLFKKAFDFKQQYHEDWEKGRAGKVASLLCWADPASFEPEDNTETHCDIDYFYKLFCTNKEQGSMGENPTWEIAIYQLITGYWDNPIESNFKPHTKRTDIHTLVKKYTKEVKS